MASHSSSVSRDRRRAELREFLRSRRARLTPADVGLPEAGRRRTPGLRREEVAVLAGVGVSWYTWLEQGRDIKVSEEVLDAVGRTLRLDAAERAHLYRLAGLNPPQAQSAPSLPVSPELQRLLDTWSPRPGYIRDRHWNFTAINDAARVVFGYGDTDHNCLISFFTNARYRVVHSHWAETAPAVAAGFRGDAAHYPDDPEFDRIAGELAAVSCGRVRHHRGHGRRPGPPRRSRRAGPDGPPGGDGQRLRRRGHRDPRQRALVHQQDGLRLQPGRILRAFPAEAGRALRRAVAAAAGGDLRVQVESMPLGRAAEAHRRIESGATTGKLVFDVGSTDHVAA